LSIEKHQQTKNILQNKGLVIRGVLSTDTAKKTCSCLMVSTGPPTVYLGHILKQTRSTKQSFEKKTLEATSYSPKHVSASGSDKRETNNS